MMSAQPASWAITAVVQSAVKAKRRGTPPVAIVANTVRSALIVNEAGWVNVVA